MSSDWKKIDEFSNVRRGASPRPIGDPKYFGGSVGWIRIADVTKSKKYLKKTTQYVSPLGESLSVKVEKGDLIMSICGTIGKPVIIDFPSCIHDGFVQFYDIKDTDINYLYYQLQFNEKGLERQGQPGTQVNLNTSIVGNYKIFHPSKPQQTKIAKILTTIDNVIEKTEAAIAKYEAIKQGMMHDLFTRGIGADGQLRPSYADAPELYKDSALGWIPREWEVEPIDEVADIRVSNVDKKTYAGQQNVLLCNYMDVYNNRFIKNGLPFMESTASIDEIRKFKVELDDVIITKDSETPFDIAMPAVIQENLENTVCGYHLAMLRPNQEKIKGTFLMYNLCLSVVNRQFMTKANGSTRYGLTKDTIETANVFRPKKPEQLLIIERLNSIEKKIQFEKSVLSKQTQLKQGLMQDLLTGKVIVKADKKKK